MNSWAEMEGGCGDMRVGGVWAKSRMCTKCRTARKEEPGELVSRNGR